MTDDWVVEHLFRTPALDAPQEAALLRKLQADQSLPSITAVDTEYRYNVEVKAGCPLTDDERKVLHWLLSETFQQDRFGSDSFLKGDKVVEVAPRLCFTTAWSSNAVSVVKACGINSIRRIERSRRYLFKASTEFSQADLDELAAAVHDRMTECILTESLKTFKSDDEMAFTEWVPVLSEGKQALRDISERLGLGFDDWDVDMYTALFKDKLRRDPSDVECFDLAQSNSEHSRHWFFGGAMVIDGVKKPQTLFQMVKGTNANNTSGNSIIAFHDNSSAIRGFPVKACFPARGKGSEDGPASFQFKEVEMHGILTAETHNFPCGIAPYPGAATGTGGRIRDVHATGQGAHVVAGTSSYCVGNLQIPGYRLPWEDTSFEYPANMASPLQIEIEASNGASDYGNEYGEPVITGYTRSFGMRLANGERREWVKPIMMSSGVGLLDGKHVKKGTPSKGMIVTKLGGPAYRIGMGGGAASSRVTDDKNAGLDFNAVQRGDAEMENKMNRVIRACIELGEMNPIISIHDQGAGGSGNVLKEICEPAGAELYLRRLPCGDETMSALELWGAEYQENCGLLISPEHRDLFQAICEREKVPFGFIGEVTGTGWVTVHDERDGTTPVNVHLDDVLGKMPQKTFSSDHITPVLQPLELPQGVTVNECLDRVFRLLSVGSKRFLTTKVDRSVTGLIAQQQCVGPLHTPLADVGVIAQSHFALTGVATAIGEQPIKGLLCPKRMARLSVAESLTNLVFAKITALSDVKCSGNWMWASKLEGEGASMYDACEAMCTVMSQVGIAVDGGKDSLSMAAKAGGEVVKCPGQLAISVYAMCTDITKTVTPDLKPIPGSVLYQIKIGSPSGDRLGGSALAQVFGQLGDVSPDVDFPELLVKAFNVTQQLVEDRVILAGHDVSDGGLITAVFEMAFAGNIGVELDVKQPSSFTTIGLLFSEEVGLVLQVKEESQSVLESAFNECGVPVERLGSVTCGERIILAVNHEIVVDETVAKLRDLWEATSFELDLLQANPKCVEQERDGMSSRRDPPYKLTFTPEARSTVDESKPKVVILREEGSNGDREMASAFVAAGFDSWDVTVTDLIQGKISLDTFQGMVFVGGFSYADVLDSGKGWAGVIRFNQKVWSEFQAFYNRKDTFSLGVCNGCQLMALLGWIPGSSEIFDADSHDVSWEKQPRFIRNESGRFESRFSTVQIALDNKAMMLDGMEGSTLGVWVAHGEGKVHFPDPAIYKMVIERGLAPMRFVDDDANATTKYPFNPNGSVDGITALCSDDGRHLAMMPHPERCVNMWQFPWAPVEWKGDVSPWTRMFQNAYTWCQNNK